MPLKQSSIKMKISIDPNVKKTLDQISTNFNAMNVLLKDNIKLLTKTIQGALKLAETSSDAGQRISHKRKGKAAKCPF